MDKKKWTSVFILSLLTSCTGNHFSIQTSYLNREMLASYYVETPDPLLQQPLMGERVLVQWNLPRWYLQYEDLHIRMAIRYKNATETVFSLPVRCLKGYYNFMLKGSEYAEKRGILTYKADLIGDGRILESQVHQLWAELISIGSKE